MQEFAQSLNRKSAGLYLIITNSVDLTEKVEIIEPHLSDHCMVTCRIMKGEKIELLKEKLSIENTTRSNYQN